MRAAVAIVRTILAAAALAALFGCDTFGVDFGAPNTPSLPAGRAIDYRNDDLTGLVFAIDLPAGLRPLPGSTTATIDASAAKGDKHFKGTLVLADGAATDSLLPPPASGRTYVMFGFAPKDKGALRDLQKWIKAQTDQPVVALDVQPKVCATTQVDAGTTTYAVLAALPSTALLPIVAGAPIGRLMLSTGGTLPTCAGT